MTISKEMEEVIFIMLKVLMAMIDTCSQRVLEVFLSSTTPQSFCAQLL